ncbi:MAG: TetR/AcrR family transcriptional regulator [Acutalibacteraceae bacterium]
MIKDTFYNLPEEKRNRILKAIKHEFETAPINKISINRIIKEANISRGSYYQYFDDKNDIYIVAMQSSAKRFIDMQIEELDRYNGNIFDAFYSILCKIIKKQSEFGKKRKEHFITSSTSMGLPSGLKLKWKIISYEDVERIKRHIDTTSLNIIDDIDLDNIIETLMQITKGSVVNMFLGEGKEEEIKRNYKRKIDLIKRGFEKS